MKEDANSEQYSLLEACHKKGDMTEWNRQYSLYLLHMSDSIQLRKKQPSIISDPAEHAIIPPSDLRIKMIQSVILDIKNAKSKEAECLTQLELNLLCHSCLKEEEIFDTRLLKNEYNDYRKKVIKALQNPNYFHKYYTTKKSADLTNISMQDGIMHNTILCYANLTDATFNKISLFNSNLEGANCFAITLTSVELRNATLSKGNFIGSTLNDCQLNSSTMNDVDFTNACLENVKFDGDKIQTHDDNQKATYRNGPNLKSAIFTRATLKNVSFKGADLSDADFEEAILRGVNINSTILKGANFTFSIIDSESIIAGDPNNIIDSKTNFTCVGLSSFRIDPLTRTLLEKNIRVMKWNDWYEKHKWFQNMFVKLFWWLSNYGTSAKRTIIAFFIVNISAFIAYFCLNWNVISNMQYCNQTLPYTAELAGNTMLAIFGAADLELSGFAVLIVGFQVFASYFLLAILITRFSIMFQTLSP